MSTVTSTPDHPAGPAGTDHLDPAVPAATDPGDRSGVPAAGETVAMSATLDIVAWADPVLDARGYDPRSPYVERFWLGLLGPSVTWLLRRFARGLEEHPNGFRINLADTGRALGLGESIARNSTTQRTITRACQFGLAQRIGPDRLAVRTRLPQLSRRQLSRLPDSVQAAHQQWLDHAAEAAEHAAAHERGYESSSSA